MSNHLNNTDLKALFIAGTAATPQKFASLIDSSWNIIENDNVLLGPTSATANSFPYYIDGYTGTTGYYIPGYTAYSGQWGLVGPTGSANGLWYQTINNVPAGLTGTTGITGQIYANSTALYVNVGPATWLVIGAAGPIAGPTGAPGPTGALVETVAELTGSTTLNINQQVYFVSFNMGVTAINTTLPTTPPSGTRITVKDIGRVTGSNGRIINILRGGADTIDNGLTSVSINSPGTSLTLIYHNTKWAIV